MQVFGPCFDEFLDHTITCSFDEIEVQAMFVDSNSIICISPGLTSLGRIDFVLTIENITAEFQEVTFYSCKITTYVYVCIYCNWRVIKFVNQAFLVIKNS